MPESESLRWRVGPQWEGPAPAATAGRSRTATAGPTQQNSYRTPFSAQ